MRSAGKLLKLPVAIKAKLDKAYTDAMQKSNESFRKIREKTKFDGTFICS